MVVPDDMNYGSIFYGNSGCSVKVLHYAHSSTVWVEMQDGFIDCFSSAVLRMGGFKDLMYPSVYGVGFLGRGEFQAYSLRKKTKAYSAWSHMLERCYDVRNIGYNRYGGDGVIVSREWHNFQDFAAWYSERYLPGMHLDKDILIPGNKTYGPNSCMLVSREINNAFSYSNHVGVLPAGNKFVSTIYRNGKNKHLGTFDSIEEAKHAYWSAKIDRIRDFSGVSPQVDDGIDRHVAHITRHYL